MPDKEMERGKRRGSFSIDVHSAPIDMNFEAYLIAARCYVNI